MSRLLDLHPEPADMARLVREGMARQPKQLPAWLLYDEEGSRLFEAICEQPEYSLTRTETALLEERAPQLATALGPGVVVEFGAGSARKVSPLLHALRPAAYVALDISAAQLGPACEELQRRHPELPVLGICCDYTQLDGLPADPILDGRRRVGFYPGSSIGNFAPPEAEAMLARFRRLLGADGALLVGVDHPKEVARLEAAYDDAAGVSAAFARNLLMRLNRDLQGGFDPTAFRYRARWESGPSRITMELCSLRAQTVPLGGENWSFAAGEPLVTEHSVKYSLAAFTTLAERAGWRLAAAWSDPRGDLSLCALVPAAAPAQADSEAAHAGERQP
ncbi:MAG: L-histidine N(alpha)-methyltransferase [Synechococcaceae cyanobacterium]|nr:L-histidine N(alpha)-methyltransferase [Synechococcaceae cyanobacterium]